MKTLKTYINERKSRDKEFAKDFERGYADFKIGIMLKQARQEARSRTVNQHPKVNSQCSR